jgi:hypothetical protein
MTHLGLGYLGRSRPEILGIFGWDFLKFWGIWGEVVPKFFGIWEKSSGNFSGFGAEIWIWGKCARSLITPTYNY